MTDQYQQFTPQDEGSGCASFLPLNAITSCVTLYDIILFETTLDTVPDLLPQQGPFVMGQLVMGLPLSAIQTPLADLVQTQAVQHLQNPRILAGIDGIYLPAPGDDALYQLTMATVHVDKPDESVEVAGKPVPLSTSQKQHLETTGLTYTRNADTGQLIRVVVRAETTPAEYVGEQDGRAKVRLKDSRVLDLPPETTRVLEKNGNALIADNQKYINLNLTNRDELSRSPQKIDMSAGTATFRSQRSQFGDMNILMGLVQELARYKDNVSALSDADYKRLAAIVRTILETVGDSLLTSPHGKQILPILQPYINDPRYVGNKPVIQQPTASAIPLPRYPIGIMTTYKQDWELLGYSRGALLSSVTLAPGEEVTMEVFTWDRQRVEQEQQFGTEYASNRELSSMRRASADVAHDLTTTLGVEAGVDGGLSIPIKAVDLDLGGSGNVSQQVQEGVSLQVNEIREATVRASENYKVTHQVKIVHTSESGIETRTTRKFRNANAGRTLTLNHYEILENYYVTTRPTSSKRWVLLVDNPDLGPFDIDFIMAYEHRLQEVLMHANYRQGFEAARKIKAHEWFLDSRQRAEEEAPNLGADNSQEETSNNSIARKGIFATAYNLAEILASFIDLSNRIERAVNGLAAAQVAPTVNLDVPLNAAELRQAQDDIAKYCYWLKISNVMPGFENRARAYLGDDSDDIKALFNNHNNEDEIVRRLGLLLDAIDDDFIYTVKMIAASLVVLALLDMLSTAMITGFLGPLSVPLLPVTLPLKPLMFPVLIALAFSHDDGGLSAAISKAKRQLTTYEKKQEAETLLPPVPVESTDVVPEQPPVPQLYTDRELAEAHADFEKLVVHLEAHRIYYQNEIWRVENPNQRLERLDAMGIRPFVDNRLLGFNGRSALYPLRTYTLPTSTAEALEKFYANFDLGEIEAEAFETALPTAGTHMESMLGQCDALEPYMVQRRQIDLELARAQQQIVSEQLAQERLETARLRLQIRMMTQQKGDVIPELASGEIKKRSLPLLAVDDDRSSETSEQGEQANE